MTEELEKACKLYDYIKEKVILEDKAIKLLSHLGLDDPHVTKTKSLEEWKKVIDKFLLLNKVANKDKK